jgi:cytochrome c oxidase subunit II
MKHVIGAVIFIVLATAFALVVLNVNLLMPAPASAQAGPIDELFNLQFKLVAVLFGLVMGLVIYSVIFFRRKAGDETDGPHITGKNSLEIGWTVIPLLIVIALSLIGSKLLGDTLRIDPQALVVKVTGHQWAWSFEYPAYGVISDTLTLPVNKQALLEITSLDVIHGFWVPEFRLKADAVPGIVHDLRVTPDKLGVYGLECSVLCGTGHTFMRAVVNVVSQADFQAWVTQAQAVVNDPVLRGENWVKQTGCLGCHSIDGSKNIAPTLKGLYGSQVSLSDGTTVTADDAYIIDSIRNPGHQIVKGFSDIMPPDIAAKLTDQQVQDIVAYIKSLK